MHVLLIEDEQGIAQFVINGLTEEGISADHASTVAEARSKLDHTNPDVIILDLLLPDGDGLSFCMALRNQGSQVPIIMLTAKSSVPDRVNGLSAGADDYLIKPFAFEELLARIRVLLRKRGQTPSQRLVFEGICLDALQRRVWKHDKEVPLSNREFRLLEYMMRNVGTTLSRSQIAENVWQMGFNNFTNVIDVFIRHLRSKLEDEGGPKLIRTIRGQGYVFGKTNGSNDSV